jgi:hypothetical protein
VETFYVAGKKADGTEVENGWEKEVRFFAFN